MCAEWSRTTKINEAHRATPQGVIVSALMEAILWKINQWATRVGLEVYTENIDL